MKEQTIKIKGDRLAIFEDAVLVDEQNGNLSAFSGDDFDVAEDERSYVARYVTSFKNRLKELVPAIVNRHPETQPEQAKSGANALTDMQATLAELLARNNTLTIENQQLRSALAEKELQIELLRLKANFLDAY